MGRRDRHAGRFGRVECPSACYGALVAIAVIVFVARLTPLASAQTNADTHASTLAAREKEECIKNLKTIYAAIQAYQMDHKDLPNWLSDLVPQYLPDANVLVCPLCRRTGKVEDAQLADPKMPSSYLFEFCPIYVDTGNRNGPIHTRREWKRRQMGLLGSVVPIVRCRHHDKVLNLAFDGQIYESPPFWEYLFTNRVSAAELTAARLFAGEAAPAPKPQAGSRFPQRDPGAGPGMLDLTRHYNATLAESFPGQPNLNLAALPAGLRNFAGVEFDVRGIVQAGSQLLLDNRYPMQIKGIAVHQKCKHLHFLHAVRFATPADAGNQVASYFVHYAGNPAHLEIPIICDRDLGDWLASPNESSPPRELTVAWSANPMPRAEGGSPRLFMATWTNLLPDTEIESIDFISNMSGPAPFLIAISTD